MLTSEVQSRSPEWLLYGMLVLLPWCWLRCLTGEWSFNTLVALSGLVLLAREYGRWWPGLSGADDSTHLRGFVAGFLTLCFGLFLLTCFSPLGILGNCVALTLPPLGLRLLRVGTSRASQGGRVSLPELLCVGVCGLGVTAWATDALSPVVADGAHVTYRLWQDSFIHSRLISLFAFGQGAGTLSDMLMSGRPLALYHYAIYPVPAALLAVSHTGAFELYCGFLLPFGMLIAGMSAFVFAASLWGAWPGLAAATAVAVLPDAYLQGFANRYISYTFMQQVNPGGYYGVGVAALAWTYILSACRDGRLTHVATGYATLLAELAFKAHLFVANSFLIMIYPCLFFSRIKPAYRALIAVALCGVFFASIAVSQHVSGVPTLRLDGSSIVPYVRDVLSYFEAGRIGDGFRRMLGPFDPANPFQLAVATVMLGVCTLGLWLPLAIAGSILLKRRAAATAVVAFPWLIIANYLVMSLGLAYDEHKIGAPDELLNRPLVWAHFAIAAFGAGACYQTLRGNRPPRPLPVLVSLGVAVLVAAWAALYLGRNIQTFPRWPEMVRHEQFNRYPVCLIDAARYIRHHSKPSEIVQDSTNDPKLLVSGLAERQAFAIDFIFGVRAPDGIAERLSALERLQHLATESEVRAEMSRHGIDWYLAHPETALAWPDTLLDDAAFACGNYRVFRFGQTPGP